MTRPSAIILPGSIFDWLVAIWLIATNSCGLHAEDKEVLFEAKIRPVLLGTCFPCHGDGKFSGSLKVDSREALLKGGDSGPAIVPGKPESSLLIRAIQRHDSVAAMPPDKKHALRPDQIADLVSWVKSGAPWPASSKKFETTKHWAFQPVRDVPAPEVKDKSWNKTSIDSFIRARQEATGVLPAPPANKLTLIRRATFDLTGLPPTPKEIDDFLVDNSTKAFETVVNRLLQSPAYGEHWGRHWLDVVRYADTAGETADYPVPSAWRYRNYVINSFNTDKPYDEFLREQVAGDVLASEGPRERFAERVTATGFLALSRRFGFDSENYHHLTIQDSIDTLGQSIMGLSVGCARCHDHKFDPISMHDYYALYGIFASTRYAFPGSEQKQKTRTLAPLLPRAEAESAWREYQSKMARLAGNMGQEIPPALLCSMNDMDGDFELQAPAAGGSNGVLVPPWRYQGKIAVTNAAQSPYQNLFRRGKVGASVPADAGKYHFSQALYPPRNAANTHLLYVNLDFRVTSAERGSKASHRFAMGALGGKSAVEIVITGETVSFLSSGKTTPICPVKLNEWNNLQLTLDLQKNTVSGLVGIPGSIPYFSAKVNIVDWPCVINQVVFERYGSPLGELPAIEFDNLGIQDTPIAPVSKKTPVLAASKELDPEKLTERLQVLTGIDGDLELQTNNAPPARPWNPGPNSVVKLSSDSQSPFHNRYPPGKLGIHLPNRGEYDGFGLTLTNLKPDNKQRLYASFDFRCVENTKGGQGSWRYYLGHGPGNSAAIELFFNDHEFFHRSGDTKNSVSPLILDQWYQVQLTLDLKAKIYTGVLASAKNKIDFSGQLATSWDGLIDYSFIDSYGHLPGVRPSLDADNFYYGEKSTPPLDGTPIPVSDDSQRRVQVAEIRHQLATIQANTAKAKQQLEALLASEPFPMAYAVAEGTSHNARVQLRGEPDQLGPEVSRGFIKALGGKPLPESTTGSGRMELAYWLTRPDHPLTARVMVNRLWQHHFGQGLVKTPNDFGVRGQPPIDPALLDHLATQLLRSGWSIKSMHRLIMLSATYQQAPGSTDNYQTGFSRRRLSAEEIRDSILAISGELDAAPGQEHPFPSPITWGFSQHAPFIAVYAHKKRSIYLMTQRLKRHPFLTLFDGADPNASTADRLVTTVPTQSLYFLNDPFIHTTSEKWAQRLRSTSASESDCIVQAYRQAYGRSPTEAESGDAAEFLASYRVELKAEKTDKLEMRSLAAFLRTLFGSNEFLHVE
ncbi:MAG TPA: PSD1 and planctomycete cytochrome C domain-containing protein [Gemmatales bacterium]|nr:PSD1 and planctomycete cytochrome C domain-containing protein [Gemmatales bacterium]